jgi:aryl-alcohol dehydrogenase-like predicted oxidoreductase
LDEISPVPSAACLHVAGDLLGCRTLLFHSAVENSRATLRRDIEDEHVPLAAEFGMGILPWSPLAYGLLAGKYDRAAVEAAGPRAGGLPRDSATKDEKRPVNDKRLDGANPFGETLFTKRNWQIVDVLRRVANEAGQSPLVAGVTAIVEVLGSALHSGAHGRPSASTP